MNGKRVAKKAPNLGKGGSVTKSRSESKGVCQAGGKKSTASN